MGKGGRDSRRREKKRGCPDLCWRTKACFGVEERSSEPVECYWGIAAW